MITARRAGLDRLAGVRRGVVAEFDEERGLGVVRIEDGASYPFHCSAVSDGTRAIDAGAAVDVELAYGRSGAVEASVVVKLA